MADYSNPPSITLIFGKTGSRKTSFGWLLKVLRWLRGAVLAVYAVSVLAVLELFAWLIVDRDGPQTPLGGLSLALFCIGAVLVLYCFTISFCLSLLLR